MENIIIQNIPGKGRGVIAAKSFVRGEVIESAPILLFPAKELNNLAKTTIGKYWFRWDDSSRALALGYGSIYNHSFTPNAFCIPNHKDNTILYRALRPISAGEEITFNYNGKIDPNGKMPFVVN